MDPATLDVRGAPTYVQYGMWLLMTLSGCLLARVSFLPFHVPYHWLPSCSKCFKLVGPSKEVFQIEHYHLSPLQQISNLCTSLAYATLIFAVGPNPIFPWNNDNWWFWPVVYLSIIGFGCIGVGKGFQTAITCPPNWPLSSWIAYGLATLWVAFQWAWVWYYAYQFEWQAYLFYFVLPVAWYGSNFLFLHCLNPEPIRLHLHHWFLGFWLCFSLNYDHWVTWLAKAIFYGIFLQGSMAYGPESIFVLR